MAKRLSHILWTALPRCAMTMLPPDPIFVLQGEMSSILCVELSIADQLIYCGSQAGLVHIWSLETYRQKNCFANSKESCLALKLLTDNELVVQDKAGVVRLWTRTNGAWEIKNEVSFEYFGFCPIKIYKDTLIAPVNSSKLQIFQLQNWSSSALLQLSDDDEKTGEVMSFQVIEISKEPYILAALESGEVRLCDWKDGKKSGNSLMLADCPMAVDFDSLSLRGIVGTSGVFVTLFSLTPDLDLISKRTLTLVNEGVATVCIRPDKKVAALGCWDGKVRLISWKTFVTLAVLDTHSSTVNALNFSEQTPFILASGCKDGNVSLWDLYNPKR